jgi:hypothetical protein
MRKILLVIIGLWLLTAPLQGQAKRLWVLRSPGEMVEYDPATFAVRQTVKVPAEAVESPGNISVNRLGQILYEAAVSLPLSEEDAPSAHKVWLWNGRAATTPAETSAAATTIDQDVKREVTTTGSNQAVTESAAVAYLSAAAAAAAAADGGHLFWFANQARRLQREDVSLSTATTWQAWRTDLGGAGREDLATSKFPDCKCPTGTCDESCPYGVVWAPDTGIDKFFLMTQFVAGQTVPVYKASTLYREKGGKWTADALSEPLQRVLDATADGEAIVEAIPDTGCCGWSNQSNDLTLVLSGEKLGQKKITVFDEQATYKNPDYDVSFYTSNARLSPELGYVAMTIVSTAQENKAIQLAQEGQGNPEELQRIRKAMAELPAVEVKRMLESPERVVFLPHATLVGWISENEILIIEDRLLVVYNVGTGARRKSSLRVEDVARVFLR